MVTDNDIIEIIRRRNLILSLVCGMCESYSWEENFQLSEVKKTFKDLKEDLQKIEWKELTEEQRRLLGFCTFNDESAKHTMVPLYIYDSLPKGLELICIDASKAKTGDDDIDLDVRCGCIPYRLTMWD